MASTQRAQTAHRAPLEKTARALTEPFVDFVKAQSASGWMLLSAVIVALAWANSTWAGAYFAFRDVPVALHVGDVELGMTLRQWVNDGFMAVFFFLLGLELKRELLVGQLSAPARAAGILCAAAGGMLLPALLFLLATDTPDVRAAWAIPVATDTAFALMLLVMLGDRVPTAARVFLVGLAIVDDIGAILVIALAYTASFDATLLLPTVAAIGLLAMLNLAGVRNGIPYLLVGSVVWLLFMGLGLHTTLAGIVVACAAPVRPAIPRSRFPDQIRRQARRFESKQRTDTASILEQPEQQQIAEDVLRVATNATVPLNRWETRLERPVSMLVMPTFAFCNAGIAISAAGLAQTFGDQLGVAILLGLLLGKPIGILLGTMLGRVLKIAELPAGLQWRHLIGIALLSGIGFTMSLFIATLSFGDGSARLSMATQSVMLASLFAGAAGYAWLRWIATSAGHDRAGPNLESGKSHLHDKE